MTVRELLGKLTAKEIAEWQAFYKLDPFGSLRSDWQMGQIASLIYNTHSEKGAKSPKDFMLNMAEDEDMEQSVKDQVNIAHFLGDMVGGLVTTAEDRDS